MWQPGDPANLSALVLRFNRHPRPGRDDGFAITVDARARVIVFRGGTGDHRMTLRRLTPGRPIEAADVLAIEYRERRP